MGWEEGFSDLLNNLRVDRVRFPARSWQSNEPLRLGGSPEPSAGKPRDQVPQPPAEPLVIDVADVDAEAALAAGNYTLAVWTAASSRFTFYYDEPESHLILAGRAILTPVDRDGYPIGPPVELRAGQCARTPPRAAALWEVLEPVTKRTTCREPFRMVASGWILQPPKYWPAWPPPADSAPAGAAAGEAAPMAPGNQTRLRPG